MCGRFAVVSPVSELLEAFGLAQSPDFELAPQYNVAPTQMAPVVIGHQPQRVLRLYRWGLVPPWAKDLSMASRLINARGETLKEKPSFRSAYAHRRCLVVANGFFEWHKGPPKTPFYFHARSNKPFAMAGLWEVWKKQQPELYSFCIITTDADDSVRPVHQRMPVILSPADYEAWLNPEIRDPLPLLGFVSSEFLVSYVVSSEINSPRNNHPGLLARFTPAAD